MRKENKTRQAYIEPKVNIYEVEEIPVICTSAHPAPSSSIEEEWGNDQEIDGGDMDL